MIVAKIYSYIVLISYDGSYFFGWAKQINKLTVQGYIENSLSKIFKKKIKILGTSRTDKGVHAIEQIFSLKIFINFSEKNLLKILKKLLKDLILVKKVKKVENFFHPIRNVEKKEYRYFINIGKYNIFQKKYYWEYNSFININNLNKKLKIFEGKHDFFNYCYCKIKDKKKTNTVREIISAKSWKRKNVIIISFVSKSFLRYQIRAILGEVVNSFNNKNNNIGNERLKKLLDKKDNNKYRYLAPSSGLYLWKIFLKKIKKY